MSKGEAQAERLDEEIVRAAEGTNGDAVTIEAAEAEGEEKSRPSMVTEKQIEELKAKAEENYQRFLRTQADFDNFRRRTRQEKEDLLKYGATRFIEQLLPVLDNLERAVQAGAASANHESLMQGLNMVLRQLYGVFDGEGIEAIDQAGVPFDPSLHQPMMKVENKELPDNTVVAVLQKGYRLKEKVLRPAMVQVN
jgi:molecular chaperone GrpE